MVIKYEFWTLGRLKTKKMKINKNQIEKKRKGNIYPILSLKLWYQMIWYGINTRGVRFELPCWSNISRQEHCLRFESLHKQDRSCLAWIILWSILYDWCLLVHIKRNTILGDIIDLLKQEKERKKERTNSLEILQYVPYGN